MGITFDENGTGYIWEKGGRVLLLDEAGNQLSEPLINISDEVGNWWDHGCLGFVLHPNFLENGYFYLFYVVDRHHLMHFGTPTYDANTNTYTDATIARITRYTADPSTNFTTTIEGSRKVLVGETKETGFPVLMPSHGVGSLVFGTDDVGSSPPPPDDFFLSQRTRSAAPFAAAGT